MERLRNAAQAGAKSALVRFMTLAGLGALAAIPIACGGAAYEPPGLPPVVPYAPLEAPTDCTTRPELCGLDLVDLGGGDHPHAFHIVFIGDGYEADRLDLFRARVFQLHLGYTTHPDGIARREPDLFHFWRLDVASREPMVDNDDRTDTPLATYLSGDDCEGPKIAAAEARFSLAYRAARSDAVERPPASAVTFVLISRDSSGVANATPYGNARISSQSSLFVLRHELGHALFRLGDEYVTRETCERLTRPSGELEGPLPLAEADNLSSPNVTASGWPDKWAGLAPDVDEGGSQLPCLFHPTADCIMLHDTNTFCPVCQATVDEHIDLRRCEDDRRAPAAAVSDAWTLDPGQSHLAIGAAGYDERGDVVLEEWTWAGPPGDDNVPDADAPVTQGRFAVFDLVGRHPGEQIWAAFRDAAGNRVRSAPFVIPEEAFPHIEWTSIRNDAEHGQIVEIDTSRPFTPVEVSEGDHTPLILQADDEGHIELTVARTGPDEPIQVTPLSLDRRLRGLTVTANDERAPALENATPPMTRINSVAVNSLPTELNISDGSTLTTVEAVTPDTILEVWLATCVPLAELKIFFGDTLVGATRPQRQSLHSCSAVTNTTSGSAYRIALHLSEDVEPGAVRVDVTDTLGRTVEWTSTWTPSVLTDCPAPPLSAEPTSGLLNVFTVSSSASIVRGEGLDWVRVNAPSASTARELSLGDLPPGPPISVRVIDTVTCEGLQTATSAPLPSWDTAPPAMLAFDGDVLLLDESERVWLSLDDGPDVSLDLDDGIAVQSVAGAAEVTVTDAENNRAKGLVEPLSKPHPTAPTCDGGEG